MSSGNCSSNIFPKIARFGGKRAPRGWHWRETQPCSLPQTYDCFITSYVNMSSKRRKSCAKKMFSLVRNYINTKSKGSDKCTRILLTRNTKTNRRSAWSDITLMSVVSESTNISLSQVDRFLTVTVCLHRG